MKPPAAKIIKSVKFEDGTFSIRPAQASMPSAKAEAEEPAPTFVDPVRAAAEAEARALLEAARHEAEALLSAARAEAEAHMLAAAEAIAQEREQALAEGRESGFATGRETGYEAGREAFLAAYAERLETLARAAEDDASQRRAWFFSQRQDLVRMAILIAEKVLASELRYSREAAVALAETALSRLSDRSRVRLRVHPEDLALVAAARDTLAGRLDHLGELELVADPLVGLGGCIAETRTATVDARLATQLEKIAAALLELPIGAGREAFEPLIAAAIATLAGEEPPEPPLASAEPLAAPSAPAPAPPAAAIAAAEAAEAEARALLESARQEAEAMREAARQELEAALSARAEPAEPAPAPPSAPQAPLEQAPGDVPAPELSVPEAPAPTPAAEAPTGEEDSPAGPDAAGDPTKRAADLLAARLGKKRTRRGGWAEPLTESEQQALEAALGDETLAEIIERVVPRLPGSEAEAAEAPEAPLDPAEALAIRLGKKKPGAPKREQPSDPRLEELERALTDETIAEIVEKVIPRMAPGDAEPSKPADEPNLETAADQLYKLLGKKKKKQGARPWYEQIDLQ